MCTAVQRPLSAASNRICMKWKTDRRWVRACSDCRLLLQQFKSAVFCFCGAIAVSRLLPPLAVDQRPPTNFDFEFFREALKCVCVCARLLPVASCSDNDDCTKITRQQKNCQLPATKRPVALHLPFASHVCHVFKEKVCVPAKRDYATDAATDTSHDFASIFNAFHIWSL